MCVSKNTHHVFLKRLEGYGKLSYNQRRLKRLHDEQDGKCHWCDSEMNLWWEVSSAEYRREHLHTATIEHYVPRTNGGTSAITNLVVACHICNALRGSIPAEKFEWVTENPKRYKRWRELKRLRSIRGKKIKEKNAIVRFNKKVVDLALTFFLMNKYKLEFLNG